MVISKEWKNIIKDDLLVSYDFNIFYPSAQIALKSTWSKTESTCPFKKIWAKQFLVCLTVEGGMN